MLTVRGTATPFYVRGHTARGPWNLLESSLMGLNLLYVTQRAPGAVQSAVMQAVADEALAAGCDTWLLHRPENSQWLDGVIIPARKVGIIHDDALPPSLRPLPTSIHSIPLDLSSLWPDSSSGPDAQEADAAWKEKSIEESLGSAYNCFARALAVHDEWEAIYIGAMNFESANLLAQNYIQRIYGDASLPKEGRQDDRFLGAATPSGAADFIPQLTAGLKRYFIKGRAGSGKSTMLKRLAAEGLRRGFDAEVYHCGFDPNSIDMVILRELGVAVFDSTSPHEYFPERDTDELIDMYATCITPGTDEANADALAVVQSRYAACMKEAIGHLAEAQRLRDSIEQARADAAHTQRLLHLARQAAADLLRNGAGCLQAAPRVQT